MSKAQPVINRTLSGLQDPVMNHVGMGLTYFLPVDF
jgi:hypothetical protein